MAQKKETAVVYSQEELAPGIFSMWIVTDIADEARPGQFISVYSQDGSRLLPRPISICEADPDEGRLRIVYRIAGKGTDEFSKYVSCHHLFYWLSLCTWRGTFTCIIS